MAGATIEPPRERSVMSLTDEVMALHRRHWSGRLSQAQSKLKHGKSAEAQRILEDERTARECIVYMCELVEAKRRLEEQIPKTMADCERYLTGDMRQALLGNSEKQAA